MWNSSFEAEPQCDESGARDIQEDSVLTVGQMYDEEVIDDFSQIPLSTRDS